MPKLMCKPLRQQQKCMQYILSLCAFFQQWFDRHWCSCSRIAPISERLLCNLPSSPARYSQFNWDFPEIFLIFFSVILKRIHRHTCHMAGVCLFMCRDEFSGNIPDIRHHICGCRSWRAVLERYIVVLFHCSIRLYYIAMFVLAD